MTTITGIREKFAKRFGTMMGVNDKRLHANADQMIEDERDQRLLKNRDERLGQFLG